MSAPMFPPTPPENHPYHLDRRQFIKLVTMAVASVGVSSTVASKILEAAELGLKPSVIWLHFQECTGCTESLLRTTHPDIGKLLLDLISLDYHETLFAAAGQQAEDALHTAMEQNAGKYVLVIEGAIPTKDGGIYCQIGGRTAIEMATEVASKAGAIIAIGSCAAWGGVASADPNPTGATGVPMVLEGKTIVTLPGCPANPYVLLGTVLQYVTLGTLPALDDAGRPLFAYARTIHEDCPRRPHFDAGRFALAYGDEDHRLGHCLYKLGCKGPSAHAPCALRRFGDVDAWPIGIGHPCYGCTEEEVGFRLALHETVPIERPTPPDTYPGAREPQGKVAALATGVAGLAIGGALGAGWVAAKKAGDGPPEEEA